MSTWPFHRATIVSRLISSITMSEKTSIKYVKYRVQPQLTLIPTFYHLSYPDFRFKGIPAIKRQYAINHLSLYSGSRCSPFHTGIKLSAIEQSPNVMNCDFVYDNNGKDRQRRGTYMLQVRTTFLGEIYTISFNNRLDGNTLEDDG